MHIPCWLPRSPGAVTSLLAAALFGCTASESASPADRSAALVHATLDEALDCVEGYVTANHCDWAHWSELYEVCGTYGYPELDDGYLLDEVKAGRCTPATWPAMRAHIVAGDCAPAPDAPSVDTVFDALACVYDHYVLEDACDWAHWSELYERCHTYAFPETDDGYLLGEVASGRCSRDHWPDMVTHMVGGGDADAGAGGYQDAGAPELAVFVSATRGDDQSAGRSPSAPVRSIARAIALAAACLPSACEVRIAAGEYVQPDTLRLVDGVSLLGGFDEEFGRTMAPSAVRISGSANPLVVAENLTRSTVVDRVTLVGANAAVTGAEAVTVRVLDTPASAGLVFSDDVIVAGSGGPGAAGGNGGITGCFAPGGSQAVSFDCGSNSGGRGTAGGDPVNGGAGGFGGASNCPNACPLVGGDGVSSGGPGGAGGNGAHATAAPVLDGNRSGSFAGDDWRPSVAANGFRGANGTGGGAGGSGGTKRFRACFGCGSLLGGAGGAGGSGGCGGGGGAGAGQGGASIGVLALRSVLSMPGSQVVRGSGGVGGRGGAGAFGGGGQGGAAGGGTRHQCCGLICYNSAAGGTGGAGGAGGSGGGGGGGNGGPSVGVALVGAASALNSAPTFANGAGGTGGQGGPGGPGAVGGPSGQTGALMDAARF